MNERPPVAHDDIRGKVYLIGAGPGDVELLTLKAVRALSMADVVLLDELVNPAVLDFVSSSAEVINVGKRGGHKSTPQNFIHEQMIAYARSGKCVARVKGGDPFVFGRGGEEIVALLGSGVEVEVVSGITSGTAVPAALGIPLSHRDHAQTIVFVTGHSKPDGKQPNWKALVETGGTLVIYMGITNLAFIVEQLLAAGLSPDTVSAAIENGTLPEQRSVVAPLFELPAKVNEGGIKSPAIVVVGEVVSLARQVAHPTSDSDNDPVAVRLGVRASRPHPRSGQDARAPRIEAHAGKEQTDAFEVLIERVSQEVL